MNYQSNRKFRIWHYTVSHSLLIIRSEKQYDDVEYLVKNTPNCTIDIEFADVKFISLPDNINGLNIRKENGVYRFDENKEHFVKASLCRIGISQFDHNEDLLTNPSLEYDEIAMTL